MWGGVQLKVIRFDENRGLGEALKTAVEDCSYELVARMDSDDIAVSNRFELQLCAFMSHPEVSIIGGQIEEFIRSPDDVVGKRKVPQSDVELKVYMKRRCPFNHMTVMFKKSDVLKAGNYQDWFWNEDYYLWIRLAAEKYKFAYLPDILVYTRVGEDMYKRRGGKKYFQSEYGLQKLMLEKRMIGTTTFIGNIGKRFIVQRMLPNRVRAWVFKKFARSKG